MRFSWGKSELLLEIQESWKFIYFVCTLKFFFCFVIRACAVSSIKLSSVNFIVKSREYETITSFQVFRSKCLWITELRLAAQILWATHIVAIGFAHRQVWAAIQLGISLQHHVKLWMASDVIVSFARPTKSILAFTQLIQSEMTRFYHIEIYIWMLHLISF